MVERRLGSRRVGAEDLGASPSDSFGAGGWFVKRGGGTTRALKPLQGRSVAGWRHREHLRCTFHESRNERCFKRRAQSKVKEQQTQTDVREGRAPLLDLSRGGGKKCRSVR